MSCEKLNKYSFQKEIDLNLFIVPEPWQSLQGLATVLSPPQHVPALAQQTWISWGQGGGYPHGGLGCLHRAVSHITLNGGQTPNAINWEILLAGLGATSSWYGQDLLGLERGQWVIGSMAATALLCQPTGPGSPELGTHLFYLGLVTESCTHFI